MKKFFKIIFGRPFIIGFAITLQVAFLIGLSTFFGGSNVFVWIAFEVVAMIAVINLINRDMLPEGKITWIIILLIFPLCGVILYILFSENRISYRQFRLLQKIISKSIDSLKADLDLSETFKPYLNAYFGQAKYLLETSNAAFFCCTQTKYFSNGTDFWKDLLVQLNKAKKYIFLEYFIIQEGIMWDSILEILKHKVKAGIEVRVMYDDIGSISKLPYNYHKKLQKLGIDCVKFNKFVPIATAVHNNRDHRKIAVIDGTVGFVGGSNLADEYINKNTKFGHWKDSAVRLSGSAVKSLAVMFLQLFDLQTKRFGSSWENYLPKTENPDLLEGEKSKNLEKGFVTPFGDGPKPLFPELIAEQAYLNIINQSQNYLYITTPYLILDERLRGALQCAARRGVDVRIITPGIPDKKFVFTVTRFNYKPLQEAGVKIYQYTHGFLHSKSIIADNTVGIIGTINLDYRSLLHHYECGVWMYKTNALLELKTDIDQTLEVSQLQEKSTLNTFQRFLAKVAMIFAPLL